jgi:effector-binding domain-containing protein
MKDKGIEEKHEEHICRFNDGEQICDCYNAGYAQAISQYKDSLVDWVYENQYEVMGDFVIDVDNLVGKLKNIN